MGLFTLETDYPSETGYPLDNSRQTNTVLNFGWTLTIPLTLSICFFFNFDGF